MVVVYHNSAEMDNQNDKVSGVVKRWMDTQALYVNLERTNDDKYKGGYGLVRHVVPDDKEMTLYASDNKVRLPPWQTFQIPHPVTSVSKLVSLTSLAIRSRSHASITHFFSKSSDPSICEIPHLLLLVSPGILST